MMMFESRKRKWGARLVAPLAAVLFVTGCGEESEPADAGNGGETEAVEPTAEPGDDSTSGEAAEGLVIDGELVIEQSLWDEAREGPTGVLYSSANEEASLAIVEQFEEETGITMELVRATPNVLFERVVSEFGADVLNADAIYTTHQYMSQYVEMGVTVDHKTPSYDGYGKEFVEGEGAAYATDVSTVVLTYNTELVDEPPTTWAEMAEPGRFDCGVGVPQPGLGSSGWVAAMFQREVLGEEFWHDVAALDPNIYTSNSTTAQDIARGEICIAPVTGTSTRSAIEEGSPIGFVLPEEGVPVYSTYVAATELGDNPAAGKAFVNWMTSSSGARFAAIEGGRYAPRVGLDAPSFGPDPEHQLPPFEEANLWQPDPARSDEVQEAWTQEWYDIYGYLPTDS